MVRPNARNYQRLGRSAADRNLVAGARRYTPPQSSARSFGGPPGTGTVQSKAAPQPVMSPELQRFLGSLGPKPASAAATADANLKAIAERLGAGGPHAQTKTAGPMARPPSVSPARPTTTADQALVQQAQRAGSGVPSLAAAATVADQNLLARAAAAGPGTFDRTEFSPAELLQAAVSGAATAPAATAVQQPSPYAGIDLTSRANTNARQVLPSATEQRVDALRHLVDSQGIDVTSRGNVGIQHDTTSPFDTAPEAPLVARPFAEAPRNGMGVAPEDQWMVDRWGAGPYTDEQVHEWLGTPQAQNLLGITPGVAAGSGPSGGVAGNSGGAAGGTTGGGGVADVVVGGDDYTGSQFGGHGGDAAALKRALSALGFQTGELTQQQMDAQWDLDEKYAALYRALPGMFNRRGMIDSGLYDRGWDRTASYQTEEQNRQDRRFDSLANQLNLSEWNAESGYALGGLQGLIDNAAALAASTADISGSTGGAPVSTNPTFSGGGVAGAVGGPPNTQVADRVAAFNDAFNQSYGGLSAAEQAAKKADLDRLFAGIAARRG